MKKQQRYKGLTKREIEYLQREDRKDLISMIAGLHLLAAVLIFAIAFTIGVLVKW